MRLMPHQPKVKRCKPGRKHDFRHGTQIALSPNEIVFTTQNHHHNPCYEHHNQHDAGYHCDMEGIFRKRDVYCTKAGRPKQQEKAQHESRNTYDMGEKTTRAEKSFRYFVHYFFIFLICKTNKNTFMPNDKGFKNQMRKNANLFDDSIFYCKSTIKTTANDNKQLQSTTNACCRLFS